MPKALPIRLNFFRRWSPEMAWVLGYTYADGCVLKTRVHNEHTYYGLAFSSIDRPLLNKVRHLMHSEHKISYNKAAGVYMLQIARTSIAKDLMALGVEPRKTGHFHMPEIPAGLFYHFLRGYLDGDGNVRIRQQASENLSLRFISTNHRFLEEIKREVNLPCCLSGLHLTYYDKASHILGRRLYADSYDGIRLNRKYQAYQNHKRTCPTEYLVDHLNVLALGRSAQIDIIAKVHQHWTAGNLIKSQIARLLGKPNSYVCNVIKRYGW